MVLVHLRAKPPRIQDALDEMKNLPTTLDRLSDYSHQFQESLILLQQELKRIISLMQAPDYKQNALLIDLSHLSIHFVKDFQKDLKQFFIANRSEIENIVKIDMVIRY